LPCSGNQQFAPKLFFDPIPHLEDAQSDYGKKPLPFNSKKPLAEPDSERAAIYHHWLGVERTGKREQQTPDIVTTGGMGLCVTWMEVGPRVQRKT